MQKFRMYINQTKIDLFIKIKLTRNSRAERDSAWVHFPHGDKPPNNILNKSKSTLYASYGGWVGS